MTAFATHRLDGLEPDNLLAFMALLGLLRALDEARTHWRARVSWTVDAPPLRPALRTPTDIDASAVAEAAAEGLDLLARRHAFDGRKDLTLSPADAARSLRKCRPSCGPGRLRRRPVGGPRQRCGGVARPQEGGADAALPHVRPGAPALSGTPRVGAATKGASRPR